MLDKHRGILQIKKIGSLSKSIFISRELEIDGDLMQALLAHHFEITAFSLLDFNAIPFDHLPVCDWIFFYSKKAVAFFFEQKPAISFPVKYAAFGPGTAEKIRQYGSSVDFVGNGKATETAPLFIDLAKKQKVLFPRAKQSQQSIQKLLPATIKALDLVIYDNHIRTEFAIPEVDFLILTSPMNVQAYFNRYPYSPNQTIIAIGQTTAKALAKLGINKVVIPPSPSEKAIWVLLKKLIS